MRVNKHLNIINIINSFVQVCLSQNKDSKYCQEYGKTEDELAEYLMQKEKDWDMEIEYWETSNGYWHYDRPCTGYVDEDILSGFLKNEGNTFELYQECFLENKIARNAGNVIKIL